jgi:hypothetical protein
MFTSNARLCALAALLCASTACSAPTNDEEPPMVPEIEENLELSVDALDVRHGALRIEASMTDGSADVSMWLGETCEAREVGHGFATPAGFAWSLSRDEIASAIECNLLVVARGKNDEGLRVRRTTTLAVQAALVADGAESVTLLSQAASGDSTKLTFQAPSPARRLHIAGSVIGVEDDEDVEAPAGSFASSFLVGNDDLALSLLARRRVTLLGEHFLTTITVDKMTLDVSDPEPPAAAPEEPAESESYGDG